MNKYWLRLQARRVIQAFATTTGAVIFSGAHAAASLEGSASCHAYAVSGAGQVGFNTDLYCEKTVFSNSLPSADVRLFQPGETFTSNALNLNPFVGAHYGYRSSFGDLGAYAFGEADVFAKLNALQTGYDGTYFVGFDSSVNLYLHDSITVSSSTIAVGTPVTFQLTGEALGTAFDGVLNSGYTGGSYSELNANVSLVGPTGVSLRFCTGTANCSLGSLPFGSSYSALIDANVGDVFSLDIFLYADTHSQYDYGGESSLYLSGTADAFHSLHTFLLPDDTSIVLLADSGHDYSAPLTAVPEPSSAALLGLGLFILVFSMRK